MVDALRLLGDSPHNGKIFFGDLAIGKGQGHTTGGFLVQCEHQYTRSGFVQTMERIDPLPELVPDDLHGIFILMAVDAAAMDQQARWFIHCDQVFVLVQDWQCFHLQISLTPALSRRGKEEHRSPSLNGRGWGG